MRIAIIGRSENLYDSAIKLREEGHEIGMIISSKEAPEYTRSVEDFEELAKLVGCKFFRSANVSTLHDEISELPAMDIGISMNCVSILSQEIIDLFRLGILNGHGGDLPRYRGNACQAWAILNGEKKIGLCVHKMIGNELDSGDIIAREYLGISSETKITGILGWIKKALPHLFSVALQNLAANPSYVLEKQSSIPKAILRCYPRRPEDGKIDWDVSATKILRLINASNKPYAGAYCLFDDRSLTVWDATIVEYSEAFFAIPGQILNIQKGYADVAAGDETVLRIFQIQYNDVISTPDMVIRSLRDRLQSCV